MSNDVYKTPESNLIQEAPDEISLAPRMRRLGASILDGLVIGLVTVPLMYFTGGFDGISTGTQPPFGYALTMGLIGIGVFFLFNGKLLVKYGQTIGKNLLGIKIVDLNNNVPTIRKHLLLRYLAYFLPGQVPVVGQFISTINILFIFGKQRRCLHDYIAGTRVVMSEQKRRPEENKGETHGGYAD